MLLNTVYSNDLNKKAKQKFFFNYQKMRFWAKF